MGSVRMPPSNADLGVPPILLPTELANDYLVETHYEDDILRLIGAEPSRSSFLRRVAPDLRSFFGRDARLMLAQLWSLKDPIEPQLHLIVYTWLDETAAQNALDLLRSKWSAEADHARVRMLVTRMYKTFAGREE
jgi:hypothetical protein